MESLTYFKNIKTPPKKLRLLVPEIKKLKPTVALDYLLYSPHKAGKTLHKIIQSAVSNAKNTLKVNEDMLKFKVLTIEEGQKLKRYMPNARGTVRPILKRYSHVKVILESTEEIKPQAEPVKASETKEEVKTEQANAEVKVKTPKTVKKTAVKKSTNIK